MNAPGGGFRPTSTGGEDSDKREDDSRLPKKSPFKGHSQKIPRVGNIRTTPTIRPFGEATLSLPRTISTQHNPLNGGLHGEPLLSGFPNNIYRNMNAKGDSP